VPQPNPEYLEGLVRREFLALPSGLCIGPIVVLDDFNRPDGPIAGSTTSGGYHWSSVSPGTVECNQLEGGGGFASLTETFGPDLFVAIDLSVLPDNFNLFGRLLTSPNQNASGYSVQVRNRFGIMFMDLVRYPEEEIIAGGSTNEVDGVGLHDGDAVALRLLGDSIEGWARIAGTWGRVLGVTDSTHADAGHIGCYVGSINGRFDDLRLLGD
jgi:hypothetical protein